MYEAIATGVGGLLSAGINAYSAYQDRKAAQQRRDQANKQISAWQAEANRILNEQANNTVKLSSADGVKRYQQMRDSYDPTAYTLDAKPFDKSVYSVEDYLNPNRDAILADVAKTTQHTAAGAGLGHSSGALEAITRNIMEKDESLYDKAYEHMKDERSFDYGAYTDYINQQQKKLDSMQQGYKDQLEMLRGDIQFDQQNTDAIIQNRLALGNSIAQSRAQLV